MKKNGKKSTALAKRKATKALAKRKSTALAKRRAENALVKASDLKHWQDALRAKYEHASDGEIGLLLIASRRMKLNPLGGQLHLVPRRITKDGPDGKPIKVWQSTVQVGIDGWRSMAGRTMEYGGMDTPKFDEGLTLFQMIQAGRPQPKTCAVTVYRITKGVRVPFTAEVTWASRAQYYDHELGQFWARDPYGMLAKCAEALANRKAFPEVTDEVSTVASPYIPEEMPGEGGPTAAQTQEATRKMDEKQKALPAPGSVAASPAQQKAEDSMPEEWTKANRSLHAEASRLGFNPDALHVYIHAIDKVESLKKMTAARIMEWVAQMRAMTPGDAAHVEAQGKIDRAWEKSKGGKS